MKHSSILVLAVIAVFLTAAFSTAALTQTYLVQGFAPGFDDLMTMLVQPRHIRLYFAGTAKNWELAAAESRDLRASLDRVAQGVPNYLGSDVAQSLKTFTTPKLDALDAAIAGANSDQFAAAYDNLTKGCNDCHTDMKRSFLVIKRPEGAGADAAHPDQDFKPNP